MKSPFPTDIAVDPVQCRILVYHAVGVKTGSKVSGILPAPHQNGASVVTTQFACYLRYLATLRTFLPDTQEVRECHQRRSQLPPARLRPVVLLRL